MPTPRPAQRESDNPDGERNTTRFCFAGYSYPEKPDQQSSGERRSPMLMPQGNMMPATSMTTGIIVRHTLAVMHRPACLSGQVRRESTRRQSDWRLEFLTLKRRQFSHIGERWALAHRPDRTRSVTGGLTSSARLFWRWLCRPGHWTGTKRVHVGHKTHCD